MRVAARLNSLKAFGRGRGGEPLSLVVDLANEPIGPRWLRGAATLAILCGTAIALAPPVSLFSAAPAQAMPAAGEFMMNPMLLPGGAEGAGQINPLSPPPAPPPPGERAKPVIASSDSAVRIQGQVSEGLYWSLRDAGISPDLAAEYLHALSRRIDVGADVAPFDRFDLVVSKASEGEPSRLLVAGLDRFEGDDVQLMKWPVRGRVEWFDGDAGKPRSDALMAPVAGRLTSGFGSRRHPILGFARMHSGVDFGASWGSPIVAAADGQVIGAGWAGGYGRQVRVAHESGIVTTYSHMSGITAEPGQVVRQGQVIGYVGSSGLSTGPHLHFEVHVGGRPVNPLAVRMQSAAAISGPELKAFKAKLNALLSIGEKKS